MVFIPVLFEAIRYLDTSRPMLPSLLFSCLFFSLRAADDVQLARVGRKYLKRNFENGPLYVTVRREPSLHRRENRERAARTLNLITHNTHATVSLAAALRIVASRSSRCYRMCGVLVRYHGPISKFLALNRAALFTSQPYHFTFCFILKLSSRVFFPCY